MQNRAKRKQLSNVLVHGNQFENQFKQLPKLFELIRYHAHRGTASNFQSPHVAACLVLDPYTF